MSIITLPHMGDVAARGGGRRPRLQQRCTVAGEARGHATHRENFSYEGAGSEAVRAPGGMRSDPWES